jgi:hypothetical protein
MSISAMTNVAFARRADVPPINQAPRTEGEIVAATAGTPETRNSTSQMQVIATYIPTEVLTLYVAVVAALRGNDAKLLGVSWITFWTFVVLTPLIVWLVYAAKVRASNRPLPAWPNRWPVWEMSAATIAYVAWAFALPDSPFARDPSLGPWYNSAVAGIVVLIVSTLLGLIAPVVRRPLAT